MLSGALIINCGIPPSSNCATWTPLSCAEAVVLLAPLVTPVNVVELPIAVYVTCSLPINKVPELANPDVLATVIVVTESVWDWLRVVVSISSSCVM